MNSDDVVHVALAVALCIFLCYVRTTMQIMQQDQQAVRFTLRAGKLAVISWGKAARSVLQLTMRRNSSLFVSVTPDPCQRTGPCDDLEIEYVLWRSMKEEGRMMKVEDFSDKSEGISLFVKELRWFLQTFFCAKKSGNALRFSEGE